jgi:hypothetical protein
MSPTNLTLEMLCACSFPILHGCRQRGNLVGWVIWNTRWFLMSPNRSQSLLVYWSLIRYTATFDHLFVTNDLLILLDILILLCIFLCIIKFHKSSQYNSTRELLWEDYSLLTRRVWFSTLLLTTLVLGAVWTRPWEPFRYNNKSIFYLA